MVDMYSKTEDTEERTFSRLAENATKWVEKALSVLSGTGRLSEIPPKYFRYSLFKALKHEITKYQNNNEIVPPEYLHLETEYMEIIESLCHIFDPLVYSLANKIVNDKVEPEDRVSSGRYGLLLSAHRFKFDPNNSETEEQRRFYAYAFSCIRCSILDCIDKNATLLKVNYSTREALFKSRKGIRMDEQLVSDGQNAAYPISLDHEVGDGVMVGEMIDNSHAIGTVQKNPEEEIGQLEWNADAAKRLNQILTEEEYFVLYRKLVLNGRPDTEDTWFIEMENRVPAPLRPHFLHTAQEKVKFDKQCRELFEDM